jgi:hypothetical protein
MANVIHLQRSWDRQYTQPSTRAVTPRLGSAVALMIRIDACRLHQSSDFRKPMIPQMLMMMRLLINLLLMVR